MRPNIPDRHQLYVRSDAAHSALTLFADLSAPVDVYSDWVDACDAVAKEAAAGSTRPATNTSRQPGLQSRKSLAAAEEEEGYEDDGDGFVENDEVDGEAAYTGE